MLYWINCECKILNVTVRDSSLRGLSLGDLFIYLFILSEGMRGESSKSSLREKVTLAFLLLSHCWFCRGVTEQLREGPRLL